MKKQLLNGLRYMVLIALITPIMAFASAVDPNIEYRVALVIGNSDYENFPLRNPVNDATDIAAALQDLGFEVVLGTNLNRQQINQKVSEFSPLLEKADIGFFYFAGHGFQYSGENYLVPVDFNINSESDIPRESLSTSSILRKMDKAGNAVNIVILDACRNNPYAISTPADKRSLRLTTTNQKLSPLINSKNSTNSFSISRGLTRSGKVGLARINGPSGSFIAYATAPGSVAADGAGKNGLYTQHLLEYIQQPGLVVERVFKKVRIEVMKDTGGKQIPWENSSLLGEFYFTASDVPVSKSLGMDFLTPLPATQQNNKKEEADKFELQFWNSVEKSQSPALYSAYLTKYPQGHFVEIAKIQLPLLQQQQQQQQQQQRDIIVQASIKAPKKAQQHDFKQHNPQQPNPQQQGIAEKLTITTNQHKPVSTDFNIPFKASDFVKISPGCFTMGSTFGEQGRQNDELDHKVCLSEDFMMGKYEVTQAQWKAIMGRNPAYFAGCGGDCPIERISWNDIQTFLFRLNMLSDANYRLPTEAEWEYAARSNTQTATYAGNIELEGVNNAPGLDQIAWYSGNTKAKYKGGKYCEDWDEKQFSSIRCGTQKVGKKQPNAWGLYDMIGNVWEFTSDWYGNYSSRENHDPKGKRSGDLKVARGGNWADSLQQNRAAARYGFAVKEKSNNLGFRLVRQ